MAKDCLVMRGRFIGKVNSLLPESHFFQPSVMMKILGIYFTSFYGSCLWNLYSAWVDRIFSSWNVTVRNVFSLPHDTHRYLIETLTDTCHPKVLLCTWYIKFVESLKTFIYLIYLLYILSYKDVKQSKHSNRTEVEKLYLARIFECKAWKLSYPWCWKGRSGGLNKAHMQQLENPIY